MGRWGAGGTPPSTASHREPCGCALDLDIFISGAKVLTITMVGPAPASGTRSPVLAHTAPNGGRSTRTTPWPKRRVCRRLRRGRRASPCRPASVPVEPPALATVSRIVKMPDHREGGGMTGGRQGLRASAPLRVRHVHRGQRDRGDGHLVRWAAKRIATSSSVPVSMLVPPCSPITSRTTSTAEATTVMVGE
jgi:hypothetical protein